MQYPEIIQLPNRYKENVYLKHINNNRYELVTPDPYFRVCPKENNKHEYIFVDPSGGPMIYENNSFYDWKTNEEYIATKIYDEKVDETYRLVIEIK